MNAILPDPTCLQMRKLVKTKNRIEIHIESAQPHAKCTQCHKITGRIHSFYTRTIHDLAWQNQETVLITHVRKFFCQNLHCSRQIFAEDWSSWVERYGRRTKRLDEFLVKLTLMGGGQTSERLAKSMGYRWNADTLIRQVHSANIPEFSDLSVIGVDDFAFRKGQTYGTIIVDLLRRQPVDLLPDRKEETLTNWLKKHPEITVISRDRAGAYAKAAQKGSPQAVQVADRWHLMKNLSDTVERILNTKIKTMHRAYELAIQHEKSENKKEHPRKTIISRENSAPSDDHSVLTMGEQNRLERSTRVQKLYLEGTSLRGIAKELGLSRKTVRKYLTHEDPHRSRKKSHSSQIDLYQPFLKEQWESGHQNAAKLWRALVEKGYKGAASTVRHYLKLWRQPKENHQKTSQESDKPKGNYPSPRKITRLITQRDPDMTERESHMIKSLFNLEPEIKKVAKIGRQFLAIIREKRLDLFPRWLKQVNLSENKGIKRFAKNLLKDQNAVEQAMQSCWSNGQTEGQVNRLKMMKRQMYGRASLDLLRKRLILS